MTNQSANERLKYLLQQLALTQKEFADRLGISQGAISQLISGRTALSFDTLQKIGEQYRVNLNWLVSGQGEAFARQAVQQATGSSTGPILAVTVDAQSEPNIVLVPVKAQAGYVANRLEPTYLQELPAFSLPMDRFRQGTYRGFEVAGDSMEPGLFQGDLLICSYVEELKWLRDMHL
ncbi:MAG: XRE family transcriptional regulator, partial [Sphingobacteriia bacterium]